MQEQFNEQPSQERKQDESNYVYRNVINKDKKYRRTWSVISLIFAILSVCFLYFSWVGFIFGILAVGSAAMSRINLGYFDKLCLSGIIIGIFGIVFSVAGIIFGEILTKIF